MENSENYFKETLEELTEEFRDIAKENSMDPKNLAYVFLRNETPNTYRFFVDMARIGFAYINPILYGQISGITFDFQKNSLGYGEDTFIACSDFFTNKQEKGPFFRRMVDSKKHMMYFSGDSRALDTMHLEYSKERASCDCEKNCDEYENLYKIDNHSFADMLMRIATEDGKHTYDNLSKIANLKQDISLNTKEAIDQLIIKELSNRIKNHFEDYESKKR